MNKQMQNPYLYLEKKEYAESWVNGGEIPIKLASCYRSEKRNGIYTPDENIINTLNKSLINDIGPIKILGEFKSDITFKNCKFDGQEVSGEYKYSDGYIISFCREKSKILRNRLGKKICVQINDIFKLKKCIDEQMNCIGEYQRCKYTKTHQRNHFLKSKDDEWQQEYRIFWNTIKRSLYTTRAKEVWVDIPKNTAGICRI